MTVTTETKFINVRCARCVSFATVPGLAKSHLFLSPISTNIILMKVQCKLITIFFADSNIFRWSIVKGVLQKTDLKILYEEACKDCDIKRVFREIKSLFRVRISLV